jgi:hypothetical protein
MRSGQYRVTLDLDDATPLDAARGYYGLKDAGADDVEIRVSSSGDGFHVRAWFSGPRDPDVVEDLRFQYGDHAKRVLLDRTHDVKPPQMLFTYKESNAGAAGPWRSDPWRAVDDMRDRRGLDP